MKKYNNNFLHNRLTVKKIPKTEKNDMKLKPQNLKVFLYEKLFQDDRLTQITQIPKYRR